MNTLVALARIAIGIACLITAAMSMHAHADALPKTALPSLASQLKVGDVVFIRVDSLPFIKVASATNSWTNHVGIVVDTSGAEPMVAESHIPVSGMTPLSRYVGRSEAGRVAVLRLSEPLTAAQQQTLANSARRRAGIYYDAGFNLHSNREFCSRYVREVVQDATGTGLGEVQTFATMLHQNPQADLGFWRAWYFGSIPWARETVTPASLLNDDRLRPVFDGFVGGMV